ILLDVQELGTGEPVALVIHHEELIIGAPDNAVRRPWSTGEVAHLASFPAHLVRSAAILGGLGISGIAALCGGNRAPQLELALVIDQAEGELVEVLSERPLRERFTMIVLTVAI